MELEQQIIRISTMEKQLQIAQRAVTNLEEAWYNYLQAQAALNSLESYYTSRDWLEDFEADEEGKLPQSLLRGVISEDGIDNLLTRNNELQEEIKEKLCLK